MAALSIACAWAVDLARESSPALAANTEFAVAVPQEGVPAWPGLTELAVHAIPTDPGKASSHSSSLALVVDAQGRRNLVAYWFAGARESAPDVEILSSRFDLEAGAWSQAKVAVNRSDLALELDFWVRRLGNPIAWVDGRGKVHLFVVATGLGGWAASRVAQLTSADAGRTFKLLRVLPLSPWFNTSNLVRAPAAPLRDGGALLPLHFELGNKYPIALRLSPTGSPVEIVRLSGDNEALQPSIVALDGSRAIALLRDHSDARMLKLASTRDGGRSWSDQGHTNLPNPNSSVVALRLPGGALIAALNPSRQGRKELVLAMSRTGREWEIVRSVEAGMHEDEFSYPSMLIQENRLHLTYTHRRQSIKHRIFEIGAPAARAR